MGYVDGTHVKTDRFWWLPCAHTRTKWAQKINVVDIYWTFAMCHPLLIISTCLHNNPVVEAHLLSFLQMSTLGEGSALLRVLQPVVRRCGTRMSLGDSVAECLIFQFCYLSSASSFSIFSAQLPMPYAGHCEGELHRCKVRPDSCWQQHVRNKGNMPTSPTDSALMHSEGVVQRAPAAL